MTPSQDAPKYHADSPGNRTGGARLYGPESRDIFHLIKGQAAQTPDAIAIVAPQRSPLVFGDLLSHVEDTVQRLNALGLGRHDRVALVLPNGPEMAVAFLAVASGATATPLNPAYSAHEFDFYLSDLNAKALVVQSGMDSPARAAAQARDLPIIELSPVLEGPAGLFKLASDRRSDRVSSGFAQPEDVALVLHTSGTTSRPKLVPLLHANLCTSAHHIRATLELAQNDRCLNVMPLFHIHGLVGALLASLASGASVVCTPGFERPKFFDWLEAFHPTWYSAVPTLHQAILEQAEFHGDTVKRCPLRFIRSSSAALHPKLMTELECRFNAPVIESYGMTEASHQMACNPLPPRERKAGSVGIAAGPEVAIMDEAGNLLPAGRTGEVVVRGPNVMGGYENNPSANENAFTDGWFRTGDQGFKDADGYLFLTGRLKEIIVRGGEKVSPREVDEALLEHPAIAQAVTFAVPHATLGEDVAAAVVLREEASITEGEIRRAVFARLADHKVPSQVLIVAEIPKGPTGKLQRIGLSQKLASRLSAEFVAPSNLLETSLAAIWGEVLGGEKIGVHDNFFLLGGDSLSAARVVARVRAAFQVEFPLKTIFREPTVASQAVEIEAMLVDEVEGLTDEEARWESGCGGEL